MSSIAFTIPGEPKGKGRPRFARMGKFVKTYTPKETVQWENWVRMCFTQQAMKSGFNMIPAGVPIAMTVKCCFAYPQSMSDKKRAAVVWVTKKPDLDNIYKAIADSLNNLAYHDDSAIALADISKAYINAEPRTEVTIATMEVGQ